MNNILYIIPDLAKVSGGPKTRVSLFKNIFLNKRDDIIEKGNKIVKSVSFKKVNISICRICYKPYRISRLFMPSFIKIAFKKSHCFYSGCLYRNVSRTIRES